MTETVPLRPHYRYFAAVCMAATIACFVGAILYETYVGPIPEGANYGIWFAQILPPAAATASRFVQTHRRNPTEDEKRKLTRVSLALAVIIGALPGLVVGCWLLAMAVVVGDPSYELTYYVYRQQAVSLLGMGTELWFFAAVLFALILGGSYFMIRGQYGRAAQKMAARLPAQ